MSISAFADVPAQWSMAVRKSSLESNDKLVVECASRFRDWVRARFPSGTCKRVATALGASPETVDCWLDAAAPRLPGVKHLLAAMAAWGPEFAAHVLAPCGEWTRALSFAARADRLHREIEELKRDLDEAQASGAEMGMVRDVEMALAASASSLARAREAGEEL